MHEVGKFIQYLLWIHFVMTLFDRGSGYQILFQDVSIPDECVLNFEINSVR